MINVFKYVQELEKVGFTRDQADASVNLLVDLMDENFATKSDLKQTEMRIDAKFDSLRGEMEKMGTRLDAKIEGVRSEMKEMGVRLESSIRESEYRMTIKLGTLLTLAIGVTATLVRLIPGAR